MVAVICASIEMVGDGPMNRGPMKESRGLDRLPIDRVEQAVFEYGPEPVVRGDIEPLL